MDQFSNGEPPSVENVWVKTEPVDNESSEFFYISSEYGTTVVKAEPTTTIVSIADDTAAATGDAKSDIKTTATKRNVGRPKQIVRKSHDCKECGKSFSGGWSLARHHRLSHLGMKPFECNICGMKFGQKCHLKPHQATHTSDKRMFVCDECPFVSATRTIWSVHMLSHKRSPNDVLKKRFNCNECGNGYDRKHSLLRHLHAHFDLQTKKPRPKSDEEKKGLNCVECGKTFTRPDSLRRHLLCHAGARPFECDECGMRFTQKGHAKSHKIVIHDGIKPLRSISCNECDATFTTNTNLKKHRTMKHSTKRPVEHSNEGDKSTVTVVKAEPTIPVFSTAEGTVAPSINIKSDTTTAVTNGKVGGPQSIIRKWNECDVCGKDFNGEWALARHRRSHSRIRPFECDRCGMKFGQKCHVKPHRGTLSCERKLARSMKQLRTGCTTEDPNGTNVNKSKSTPRMVGTDRRRSSENLEGLVAITNNNMTEKEVETEWDPTILRETCRSDVVLGS